MSEAEVDVIVLGAGIVGVSTAYAARQRGMSVIVVDRREPGTETSYGNAGILSSGSIFPLNHPSLWKALPKYLTNRHPALRWNTVGQRAIPNGSHAFWRMQPARIPGRGRRRCAD